MGSLIEKRRFLKGIKSNYSIKKDFLKDLEKDYESFNKDKYGDLKVSLDGSLGAGFGLERLLPSKKVLNFVFSFPLLQLWSQEVVNFLMLHANNLIS